MSGGPWIATAEDSQEELLLSQVDLAMQVPFTVPVILSVQFCLSVMMPFII